MIQTLTDTQFSFPKQLEQYNGKVREVYNISDTFLVIVATDRISAFDHILPNAIPYKGQVLNQTAAFFFDAAKAVCPVHVIDVPHPNVTIGWLCKPFPLEIIVRKYLAGHAWRVYQSGQRSLCGVSLPEGLKENDPLPAPVITPTTKSVIGHDEDISEHEIIKSGMIEPDEYAEIKHHALTLFELGSELAQKQGLILVDTKYEMGERDGKIYIIDEIHTPDSSRYFYLEGYEERQRQGLPQQQLSKEFVRKWLMEHGFQGKEGQSIPHMDEGFITSVSERYIELYERVTGMPFERKDYQNIVQHIQEATTESLTQLLS